MKRVFSPITFDKFNVYIAFCFWVLGFTLWAIILLYFLSLVRLTVENCFLGITNVDKLFVRYRLWEPFGSVVFVGEQTKGVFFFN